MRLIILGPPGAGKGTQARLLARKFRVKSISVGKLLREEVREKTKVGKIVNKYLSKGDLAPDSLVDDIVNEHIKKRSLRGFILDGYPRDIRQARRLKLKYFDLVIFLNCNEREIIKRLLKRGRMDDSLEIIKHRLKVYKRETKKVINYFKKKKILREVNGDGTVKEVFKRILRVLDEI